MSQPQQKDRKRLSDLHEFSHAFTSSFDDKTPYHERMTKAYEFGRDKASSPDLSDWIARMREVRTNAINENLVSPSMPLQMLPLYRLKKGLLKSCHHKNSTSPSILMRTSLRLLRLWGLRRISTC